MLKQDRVPDVKADNILLGGVDTPEAVLAAAASSSKLAHVPHKFVYHPSLNQLESYTFTLSDLSNGQSLASLNSARANVCSEQLWFKEKKAPPGPSRPPVSVHRK